jgi:hypothetical protein
MAGRHLLWSPVMFITIPKRQPKRLRMFLDGVLATAAGELEVRVRDISEGGALIEAEGLPGEGEKASLLCSGHRLEGVILWQSDSRCGIGFEQSLSAAVLKHFSCPAMRVGAPRNYRRDRIAEDDEPVEVTPRSIRLGAKGRTGE